MDLLGIELCKIPGVVVWRQNVGTIPFRDGKTGERRAFRAGPPPGAADLSGMYKVDGRRIEVETKANGKKRSKDQERWAELVHEYNAIYLLAPQHKALTASESAKLWAQTMIKILGENNVR